jgi:hypothetical protein
MREQEAVLARDGVGAVLSRSNVMAFCALSESPSLTRYVLGVYREKSSADISDRASLL